MKLIVRADDLGYSEAVNYGIEKSVKDGITTCVGTMTNMEAAKHGLALLKDTDVCLGVHTNLCAGKPLCKVEEIASLIDPTTGEFFKSKDISARSKDTIVKEEAMREIQAQVDQFRVLTGKNPDYIDAHGISSKNFFEALEQVAKENDLFYVDVFNDEWYIQYNIHQTDSHYHNKEGMYDPYAYFLQNEAGLIETGYNLVIFHPGYLDRYIMQHSSFTTIRTLEVEALCSKEISIWMREHQVCLENFRRFKRT